MGACALDQIHVRVHLDGQAQHVQQVYYNIGNNIYLVRELLRLN